MGIFLKFIMLFYLVIDVFDLEMTHFDSITILNDYYETQIITDTIRSYIFKYLVLL